MLKDIYKRAGFRYLTLEFKEELCYEEVREIIINYEVYYDLKLWKIIDNKQLIFKYTGNRKRGNK